MAKPLCPSRDPARRPLPLVAWPAADQAAWAAALAAGDMLESSGAAAHWRPHSRRNAVQGWGHFLAWLAQDRQLDPGEDLRLRATPMRLAAYIEALRARGNAPQTVLFRLEHLDHFLRVAAAGLDRLWLKRLLAHLRRDVQSVRDKRVRLQPSHELFALGLHLTTEAEGQRPREQAVTYRDGLMIALLAARPLRLRNFAALKLGRHLVHERDGWQLVIPGVETKTRQPLDFPFPKMLVPALERYLAVHRPVLAAQRGRWHAAAGEMLWLSRDGGPMSEGALYLRLTKRTRAAFGRQVNPHLFRDAAATTIAIEDPTHVRIAAQVLGHAAFTTTQRYYNLARSQDAAAAWHHTLDGLRQI